MRNHLAKNYKTALDSLTVYRGILKNPLIKKLYILLEKLCAVGEDFDALLIEYNNFFYHLSQADEYRNFKHYVITCVLYDENAFTRIAEKHSFADIDIPLLRTVENDLENLHKVAMLSSRELKNIILSGYAAKYNSEKNTAEKLPEWDSSLNSVRDGRLNIYQILDQNQSWANCIKALAEFHRANGAGNFARYAGFIWEEQSDFHGLKGLASTDPVRLSDLVGYNAERQVVLDNTMFFLKGHPANNVLLYGDRGTGKSSTVKALLNEFAAQGLRIIEIPKKYLEDYPKIIRLIRNRPQKFILFIDDLSFEDSEESFTALKAVLEGGLESKPVNAVIYATSNRRHLVKEKFSERAGLSSGNNDEVRAADTLQEKLSLADRFGIAVTFSTPDQKKYLEIVEGLASIRNIDIDSKTLRDEALIWEMEHNGRSPRTARQFIDWLEAKIKGDDGE
ncbi:ATP-binding protein [Pelotomaculum terephthalicicum JT]|uniref:ATP-binding protein n=1 Tax=Pelotomaculum TaxID=191373 RepID=UPI0009CBB8CE|nr:MULTISPECIES: ATP-binding protein [Pelotomaculum]MCG9968048.1 ATP-binding protein [Pelotomaculum terephthalicicum JT]OPX85655.1 MAG: ATPase family associated with various cellular activities (AAA) [Pelotomaculum sp. PtaB.Bin117]OPY63973.1 MAG: ATPase family associated with various cellular activities (AAA) [Pelotomaculum sp. PtaU1.Bin065]